MVVVVHQAVGVAEPVTTTVDLPEDFKDRAPVFVVFVDGLSGIAARGDMIHRTVKFYA
jgi:hypothetical protein